MTNENNNDGVVAQFSCPIGTELMLQFEKDASHVRSSLIGMDSGKFLIIRIPEVPGLEPMLMIGKSIKVIYLFDGTIYTFITKTLIPIFSPEPLFFVTYPEVVQKQELRENLRIECSIPAMIREKDPMGFACIITDLSSAGCRVMAPFDPQVSEFAKIDSVLELSCEMLGIDQDRAIRCIIKNSTQDKKKIHMGFQFETVDADILGRIQTYVNRVFDLIS
jgi:hypothetical protein